MRDWDGRWPGLLGPRRTEALLKQVLSYSDADETEVAFSAGTEALTRFAHNVIHQNVSETDANLDVRAVFGARVGEASTNDLSPAGLEGAVRQACALARHLPPNPEWPGLPEPRPLPECLAFDDDVARLSAGPAARAGYVAEICRAARGQRLLASGAFSSEQVESALMNSKGLFAYAPFTQADMTFVVQDPESQASAYAHAAGWKLAQIDFDELRTKAIRQALASRHPRAIKPDEYAVVLEPYAVLPLLEALAEAGMGALAVQEGRSWMNNRLGRQTFSPGLSIYDDACDPEGVPQGFDCEGVPKQRVPIVLRGVPTSPVYDRRTAAREQGRESTGHAQPYDDDDWDGPVPENLVMAPGDQTVEAMIAAVDRGLYVNRLWYVNLTTTHDAGVTGTTRDGVWWIQDGELAFPVSDLRFDQSLVEVLQGVRGVGRRSSTMAGYYGFHRLPALALDSFRFVDARAGDA